MFPVDDLPADDAPEAPAGVNTVAFRTADADPRGVAFISAAALAVLGHPTSAFLRGRMTLMDVVHPGDRDALRAALSRVAVGDHLSLSYRVVDPAWVCRAADETCTIAPDGTQEGSITSVPGPGTILEVDPLTGLPSGHALHVRLDRETHDERSVDLSLVLVDVGGLGDMNGLLGHAWGDAALVDVTRRLAGSVRRRDLLCRLWGGTFAVLMVGTGVFEALAVGERLQRAARLEHPDGRPGAACVGIAQRGAGEPAEGVMARAMHAVTRAKRLGGDRVVVAPPPTPWGGPTAAGQRLGAG
ncbi:MAG: sensor domain-containing diguanylate cyclase [Thermoleophilia bacterium]